MTLLYDHHFVTMVLALAGAVIMTALLCWLERAAIRQHLVQWRANARTAGLIFRYFGPRAMRLFWQAIVLVVLTVLLKNVAANQQESFLDALFGAHRDIAEATLRLGLWQTLLFLDGWLMAMSNGYIKEAIVKATNRIVLELLWKQQFENPKAATRSQIEGSRTTDPEGIESNFHDFAEGLEAIADLIAAVIFIGMRIVYLATSVVGVAILVAIFVTPYMGSRLKDLTERRQKSSVLGRALRDTTQPGGDDAIRFHFLGLFIGQVRKFQERLLALDVQANKKEKKSIALLQSGQSLGFALLLMLFAPHLVGVGELAVLIQQAEKAQEAFTKLLDVVTHEGLKYFVHIKRIQDGALKVPLNVERGMQVPPTQADLLLEDVSYGVRDRAVESTFSVTVPKLVVKPGTVVCLPGPNGTGKHTLLTRVITGQRAAGQPATITVGGIPVSDLFPPATFALNVDGVVHEAFAADKTGTIRSYLMGALGVPMQEEMKALFELPEACVKRFLSALDLSGLDLRGIVIGEEEEEQKWLVMAALGLVEGLRPRGTWIWSELALTPRQKARARQRQQQFEDNLLIVKKEIDKVLATALTFAGLTEKVKKLSTATGMLPAVDALPKGFDTPLGDLNTFKAEHKAQLAMAFVYLQSIVMGAPIVILVEVLRVVPDPMRPQFVRMFNDLANAGKIVLYEGLPIDGCEVLFLKEGKVAFYGPFDEAKKNAVFAAWWNNRIP
jgi:ABC-type multidrug transport system fused ATPase/permease subunit